MNVNTKIAQAEQILSHVFTNKMLCAEAIQMAGPTAVFIVNRMFQQFDNNKRLAVLGDAVLSKVLCDLWYQARNSLGEPLSCAAWTTIRNQMLGNAELAQRGYNVGIQNCIHTESGYHGRASAKMVATTFEALIGAVYMDGGEEALLPVVEHLDLNQHPLLMIPYIGDLKALLEGAGIGSCTRDL